MGVWQPGENISGLATSAEVALTAKTTELVPLAKLDELEQVPKIQGAQWYVNAGSGSDGKLMCAGSGLIIQSQNATDGTNNIRFSTTVIYED